MASFNRIILMGNLTRDVQLKYLPNQTALADFGMAVNHKFKDREEVMYIDCSCFGKGAEVINQYCQKGRPLLVEGRLKLDVWEDKQGGGKRSKHSIVVDNFQLMGDRGQQRAAGPSQRPPQPSEPAVDFDSSDIPFAWSGRIDRPI